MRYDSFCDQNLSLGGLYTDTDTDDTNDDNNSNTWRTEHDCIGSLPNEPKSVSLRAPYKRRYRVYFGFLQDWYVNVTGYTFPVMGGGLKCRIIYQLLEFSLNVKGT